jgi:hypothetical protein
LFEGGEKGAELQKGKALGSLAVWGLYVVAPRFVVLCGWPAAAALRGMLGTAYKIRIRWSNFVICPFFSKNFWKLPCYDSLYWFLTFCSLEVIFSHKILLDIVLFVISPLINSSLVL